MTTTELDSAIASVRAYCGWVVAPSETITMTVDGTLATVLQLPTLKLSAVHSLTVDGVAVDPAVEFFEWSQSGFVRRAAGFGDKLRGVVAYVTHGYEQWPLDVQAVIDALATRAADVGSSTLVQVGQVRTATSADGTPWGAQLTSYEQTALDRYRLPPRP